MTLAIVATCCAAGLVLYLQYRALATLESQTQATLRQISEQTATDVAVEVRRSLDGPVRETLAGVNHPELQAGRFDLVAREFERGLQTFPQVDRFFAWHARTEAVAPGEVLFYGRSGSATGVSGGLDARFTRDSRFGRAIVEIAQRHSPAQQIYVAAEGVGPEGRHDAFLRLFWTDARRVEYFAILGFVVEPSTWRHRFFPVLYERRLAALLERRGGETSLEVRVTDERGALVFGSGPSSALASRIAFPMLFYPPDIRPRLAQGVDAHPWHIEVSASPPDGALSRGYWPTVLSVLLMLVALALTGQANRRSADLARMQADFISHVSHQLKTPLSLLSAATETLAMDRVRSPEKLSQYVGIIRGEVTRLSALVQRILEFSRLQQRRSYEFETVDLGSLVRETVDAFERSLSGRHFTFRVQETGPSPQVSADPAALEQVLANLLDNAVKYSDDVKEVTVRVRASGDDAIIEVSDRGVGIERSDQKRIFEKFYRGSASSLHREGFGLGLPIVQELVSAHGGLVEVESEPGTGSTFRVRLPLGATETVQPAQEKAQPVTGPGTIT
jgi:signal transduction histidine kinase